MSIFNKLLKCLVVATVITPAAVSPAVAGCCGAYRVNGDVAMTQGMEGQTQNVTSDNVTNSSLQMLVQDNPDWSTPASAPVPQGQDPSSGNSSGECM